MVSAGALAAVAPALLMPPATSGLAAAVLVGVAAAVAPALLMPPATSGAACLAGAACCNDF